MSLLARHALRSTSIPSTAAGAGPAICARSFHASSLRAAMSEADHGQDQGARKAAIDEHKNDQLDKQKQGEGEWKRELGSSSESAVKADRGDVKDAGKDIEDLQKKTSETSQSQHPHGKA